MRLNLKSLNPFASTHGGAQAAPLTNEQRLRRSVLACLLWENEFYEDGATIADRILELVGKVAPETVAALAIEARETQHLRHAPLLLTSALSRHAGGKLVEDTVARVVQRADELSELVAVHARLNGVEPNAVKKTLPAAMKRGLARAFLKFDAYGLAKYNRDNAIKLRDVLFLSHAKPDSPEREALWKQLIDGSLAAPDTWEVALSRGADKRATFERLIREGGLGYLALLRNLRNMVEAGCDLDLVRDAILARKGAERVLPFRYVAAARACPQLEPEIDLAFCEASATGPRFSGRTLLIVDVSGSMYGSRLSGKSDMDRALAACALAAIARNACEEPIIYATAGSDAERVHRTELVPARSGMALIDAIHGLCRPLGGGGIFLNQVMRFLMARHPVVDRVLVVTDEQDCGVGDDQPSKAPAYGRVGNYMLNVASARHGIGYPQTGWTHIDGWSEQVIRFIHELEAA